MRKSKFLWLMGGAVAGVGLVAVLFLLSENIMQHHNTFVRRFPHFPAVERQQMDLGFNSYYFAGADDTTVYLGNYTAPLQVMALDTALQQKQVFKMTLDRTDFPFRALLLRVAPPYFYVADGTVPCVYRGRISDWKAQHFPTSKTYFSQIHPLDSVTLAIRSLGPGTRTRTRTNTLGILSLNGRPTAFAPSLLKAQSDGVFDTDGSLHTDMGLQRAVYVYRYRNQYTVADRNLQLIRRGNTIDTVAHAHLQVAALSKTGERKLAAPPLVVNKMTAVSGDLLYVNSALPGKFEPLSMWKKAAIIDVYDLTTGAYRFSFYIPDQKHVRMRSFMVHGDKLFGMFGEKVVVYQMRRMTNDE